MSAEAKPLADIARILLRAHSPECWDPVLVAGFVRDASRSMPSAPRDKEDAVIVLMMESREAREKVPS